MHKNQSGRSIRFAKNVVWSLSGQACVMVVGFFLTPYLIHRLGLQLYGIYIILNAVAGYLPTLTFGASPSITKFLAEFSASGDSAKVRKAVSHSLVLHLAGPALGALALGLGAKPLLVRIFHVSGDLLPAGVFTLQCLAISTLALAATAWSLAILTGLQIFKWQSLIYAAQNALMTVGAAIAVAAGLGIKGIALWYAALNIAIGVWSLAVCAFFLRRFYGGAAVASDGHDFSEFSRYGLSLWLSQVAWIVTYQFDKIFLARGTSLAGMTLYSVPAGLLQRVQFLPAAVSGVLMPVISETSVKGSRAEVKRIYLKTLRGLLWAILPVYAYLFAIMPQFLGLWLGGGFSSASVWPVRFLILAQVMVLLCYLPNAVATGGGKPLYLAFVVWGQAVISVVAWHLLIPRYGIAGAGLGSLAAQIVPDLIYLEFVHARILSLTWKEFFMDGLHAPLVCGAMLVGALLCVHSWLETWPRLIASGLLGWALFLACGYAIAAEDDRQALKMFWAHGLSYLSRS